LVGFLSLVIATLVQFRGFPLRVSSLISLLNLSTILSAGEIAAWRLKWVALPIAIVAIWSSARLVRSIKNSPDRFIGLLPARAGFAAAIIATLMVATLIGVTVPERVRRHEWAVDAGYYAQAYTIQRALLEYRVLHGTLPTGDDLVKGLSTLPDPDGSIAAALRNMNPTGYQPNSVVAVASTKSKPLGRGTALRFATTSANADPPSVSFTNYDLRLPGPDKLLNTDDDFLVYDGLVIKASDLPASSATKPSVP
jgi:hypothetical protein